MNGINMNQFVLGFAIARPLAEQKDRLMVALTASMFPSSNPYGAIFLKPQVDALADKEAQLASLTTSDALLGLSAVTIPPGGSLDVTLNVPAVDSVTSDNLGTVQAGFDAPTRKLKLSAKAAGRAHVEIKIGTRFGRLPVTVGP